MIDQRPDSPLPKTFSIEQLARNYREKISKLSSDNTPSENNEKNPRNFPEMEKYNSVLKSIQNTSHWANRQFYEYFDVA